MFAELSSCRGDVGHFADTRAGVDVVATLKPSEAIVDYFTADANRYKGQPLLNVAQRIAWDRVEICRDGRVLAEANEANQVTLCVGDTATLRWNIRLG